MAFVDSQGCRIYYRLEGCAGKPPLALAHSLGTDHGLWDPQMAGLLSHFQVLRLDLRGHGASSAPAGDYTMPQLANDVLCVADAAGWDKFDYCGLSLGGMIGQWLGANAAGRLGRLVLANTSPRIGDPNLFEARRKTVLEHGMKAIEAAVMQRFFSAKVPASAQPAMESIRAVLLETNPVGYAGCCSAIRDMDHRPLLGKITAPTLVIVGDHDVSTPWRGHGDALAKEIPGARTAHLAAAHLSNVERPSGFNAALFDFLLAGNDPLKEGDIKRRMMLGDDHVDRALANTSAFNRDFQYLITRYAWGTIWARPGMDAKTRRLHVLAITSSLGRWEEFRLHVRTGLANELELCDLEEVLLQVAVYAGVPAANTGFQIAGEESAKQ